jgi:hypothetical protein
MPEAPRSANNFSNGEIISFADEFTALRQLASEYLHLVQQRQHSSGITRPTDDLADRLLHWLDLNVHGEKLSISIGAVNGRKPFGLICQPTPPTLLQR